MAYFAEIDENDVVVRVLVVPDEQEHRGEEFLRDDLGLGGRWVQTSYNGNIRGRYAAIGMKFDRGRDRFIPKKPFDSWTIDENDEWQPPTPMPDDGGDYEWNEETQSWDLVGGG